MKFGEAVAILWLGVLIGMALGLALIQL